jgi:hypothetical protein
LYQKWKPPFGGVIALIAREFIPWASGNIIALTHELVLGIDTLATAFIMAGAIYIALPKPRSAPSRHPSKKIPTKNAFPFTGLESAEASPFTAGRMSILLILPYQLYAAAHQENASNPKAEKRPTEAPTFNRV